MAGAGSRFTAAGYTAPKPLIDVRGRPMIRRVIENLEPAGSRFVLLVRREHMAATDAALADLRPRLQIDLVPVERPTEGAACTVLLARHALDPEAPLMLANSDQLVDFDAAAFVGDCLRRQLDASILVFRDVERNPKWSFTRMDVGGLVAETKEKDPISDLATVGIYLFARAADFIHAAIDMIVRNDRINNEFYVCPAFNYLIASGGRVGIYEVAATAMHGLGTPEDLQRYLAGFAEPQASGGGTDTQRATG